MCCVFLRFESAFLAPALLNWDLMQKSYPRTAVAVSALILSLTVAACGNIAKIKSPVVGSKSNQLTSLGIESEQSCVLSRVSKVSSLLMLGTKSRLGTLAEAHRQKLAACGEDPECITPELSRIVSNWALTSAAMEQSRRERIVRLTAECKDLLSCLIPTTARNLRALLRDETDWNDAVESEAAKRLIADTEECKNASCFAQVTGQMLRHSLTTLMRKAPAEIVLGEADEALEKLDACRELGARRPARAWGKAQNTPKTASTASATAPANPAKETPNSKPVDTYQIMHKFKVAHVTADHWMNLFKGGLYFTKTHVTAIAIDGFALIKHKDEARKILKRTRKTVEDGVRYTSRRYRFMEDKGLYYTFEDRPEEYRFMDQLKEEPQVMMSLGDTKLVAVKITHWTSDNHFRFEMTFPYSITKADFRAIDFEVEKQPNANEWNLYMVEDASTRVALDEISLKVKATLNGIDKVELKKDGTVMKTVQVSDLENTQAP